MGKLNIISEYFEFLSQQKKWWMLPIIALLLLFSTLILLTQGSPLAPFLYALF
jgi:hypothetical protein